MPRRASVEYNSSLPDYHASHRSFCRRRAEAIGTHHGVLDISTIDASSCRAHANCFLSQVTEGFVDEQSLAALTGHTFSFCLALSRIAISSGYSRVRRIDAPALVSEQALSCRRLRRQPAPSSAIAACFPPRRTRPWTGCTLGTDAAPGLSRCSTPPDSLNHIHNRRPGLHGRGFGRTEPLRRSRGYLLIVFDRKRVSTSGYREDRR